MGGWPGRWWSCVRHVPVEVLGVVAAVVIFVSIAGTYALQTPPFSTSDETAHLGYAHEVASFRLPTITTRPEIPDSATQWQAEHDSREDDRYRAVWVANHPPLHYVVVAPLIWLSDATDRADGGLMFLRMANIGFAAIGIVLTYHVACELSGGARRVGLAAAALAALLPQGHAAFAQGLNDGLGFAAGALLLWAAARCVRHGTSRHNLGLLVVAAAVGFGARATTMLMAIAVVGLVALITLRTRQGTNRQRIARCLDVSAALFPALLLFGWFYVRNIRLYGDIGASRFLLERFDRPPVGSVWSMLTQGHSWVDLYHSLFSPSPVYWVDPPAGTNAAAIVGLAGLVLVAFRRRTGDRTGWQSPSTVSRAALVVGLAALAVVVVTIAQHVSGGGNGYARYLFPALPSIVTAAALGFDRVLPRLGPALSVTALGYWAWDNVPTGVDASSVRRPRDGGYLLPEALRVLPAPPWIRDVTVAIGVVATATLALVLLVGLVRPVARTIRHVWGTERRRQTATARPPALS